MGDNKREPPVKQEALVVFKRKCVDGSLDIWDFASQIHPLRLAIAQITSLRVTEVCF